MEKKEGKEAKGDSGEDLTLNQLLREIPYEGVIYSYFFWKWFVLPARFLSLAFPTTFNHKDFVQKPTRFAFLLSFLFWICVVACIRWFLNYPQSALPDLSPRYLKGSNFGYTHPMAIPR